ncbi:MAG: efflux RND transporter permease subunit [bacterium]
MNGLFRWFSTNHVAANLLMLFIMAAGLMTAVSIKQEVFPEVSLDLISVRVPYLGASPAEVEEGVCIKVEEQIQSIDGIKKITSTANEGMGVVLAELEITAEPQEVLDDIKAEVDRIITFPLETEKPIVSLIEPRRQVMDVVVYGEVSERSLKTLADNIRDDLTALPEITQADVVGTRPFEISIEVSEAMLRRYGLGLGQVTQAVRMNSLDMPGGSVKTAAGEILVRTKGQRYTGEEFARIVVITRSDGTQVTLDQIATVRDGFADVDVRSRFDGQPAAVVSVFRVGDEGVLRVANAVKRYVETKRPDLPAGIQIATWQDSSAIYRGRMNLLLKNGAFGLVLVFFCLALFLQMRLAFWVALGILISFLGAFWVLPLFGVSLNMISLFAFIVALGLVVDDAIVVGENIFTRREMGDTPQSAATDGAIEVAAPVIFAVLTTVVAFLPIANVEGLMGKFMFNVPVVVIAVLLFSLVESLLILPAHLSTVRQVGSAGSTAESPVTGLRGLYRRGKDAFARFLHSVIHNHYRRCLAWSLRQRPLVASLAMASLIVTMGLIAGGRIKWTMMPRVDADNMIVAMTMPQGTTVERTEEVIQQVEVALNDLSAEVMQDRSEDSPPVVEHVFTTVGSQPRSAGRFAVSTASGAHLAEVNAELLSAEQRGLASGDLARRWRELTGPVPEALSLSFSANLFRGSSAIQVQLSSQDMEQLTTAATILKTELSNYPGVTDISDSFQEGKVEMKLALRPEARSLGLNLNDLARQVRHGFYGDEAMRIQRGRDEIKVMIRYPEAERRSLGHIENMMIRTPDGSEVPFYQVATVETGRGYATIERADRQRIVSVFADVDQGVTNAREVLLDLEDRVLPALMADHPGVRFSFEGEERDRAESLASLRHGFLLALLGIYTLLAVLFRSYLQPLVVMLAIPFGLIGAIWGHVLMGWDLTMLSMFGAVALTGVVVNDSLILIDFVNRARRAGAGRSEAVMEAGLRRFRPIILTSLTTFAGLTPLLLEKSLQARFLIPMAISLGFGVIFATGITLVLIPVGYTLLDDLKRRLGLQRD